MIPPNSEDNLHSFQDDANTDSLLEFVRASGRDVQKYQEAVETLAPVFSSLSFGEQPVYENLDRSALRRRMTEVQDILRWMADSRKADMKITAMQLMGFLAWESFIPYLAQYLSSEIKWERLTAIGALGEIASEQAVDALRIVVEDPDPEVRTATGLALFKIADQL